MFRRLQASLPKDPTYPADLEGLGYYINDQDEIRSIENPKAFFKFFLTKNERYNSLQREAMNEVIRNLISQRLIELGLEKIRLPLNASAKDPHLPIFVSSNLASKKRVVILFYEHMQDLGVFAHRVIGGKGGINEGSAVNMVKRILASSKDEAPGIILANMGQLRWWRRGKKAVTQTSWYALPQKSAVEIPFRFDENKNTIPGNRSPDEHVQYIFDHVVAELCHPEANLQVIGVSLGGLKVAEFLDSEENFKKWGARVVAFAAVATYYQLADFQTKDFTSWMANRGRAYITSPEPEGIFLMDPEGRRDTEGLGCPTFSLGEPYYSELMLIKGFKTVIDWFEEVAKDQEYENPEFFRKDDDEVEEDTAGRGLEPEES